MMQSTSLAPDYLLPICPLPLLLYMSCVIQGWTTSGTYKFQGFSGLNLQKLFLDYVIIQYGSRQNRMEYVGAVQ